MHIDNFEYRYTLSQYIIPLYTFKFIIPLYTFTIYNTFFTPSHFMIPLYTFAINNTVIPIHKLWYRYSHSQI